MFYYCIDCKTKFDEDDFGKRDDSFSYEGAYGLATEVIYSDCCPNCTGDSYDEIEEWFFMDEKDKVMSHGFGSEHEAKEHAKKIGATETEYGYTLFEKDKTKNFTIFNEWKYEDE